MKKRRIGIYGGTFNPVHNGHLNLAIELKEKKSLDEVWVVPAKISPFRVEEDLISVAHRLKMVNLAFSEIPDFKILESELNRPSPSYTIDTVKEFLDTNKNKDFYLILGEDALVRFSEWKNWEELAKIIPFLIGSRSSHFSLDSFSEEVRRAIENGLVVTRQMEISATEVKERLKKRLYCGHLVPAKVLDYIYENQLYFEA